MTPEPRITVMHEPEAAAMAAPEPAEHLASEPAEQLAIMNTSAPEPAGEELMRGEVAAPAAAAPVEPEPAAVEADRPIPTNDAPPSRWSGRSSSAARMSRPPRKSAGGGDARRLPAGVGSVLAPAGRSLAARQAAAGKGNAGRIEARKRARACNVRDRRRNPPDRL